MFINWKLEILILVLTLYGQVPSEGVIGGREAAPHSRPYMVLVEMKLRDKTVVRCTGFLLNEYFVMTAAHCQAKSLTVLLGLHTYLDQKEIQRLTVEQTFPHEDYDETHFKNDIMLLKLSCKAKFSKHVKPIALAAQYDGHLPESCMVSGWGRTNEFKPMSATLLEVNVTLTDNTHCAGEPLYCSEDENGPAGGDGGGPLVCGDGKAYGVVSFFKKLKSNGPTVQMYTKIPDYRHWITSTIKNALIEMQCMYPGWSNQSK